MGINPLRIYFDSCIVIYLVEEHPTFEPIIATRLSNQANMADLVIQVSDLTEPAQHHREGR